MAQPTYANFTQLGSSAAGLSANQINERTLAALAVLASGQNPDATAFTLPVSGTTTAKPATSVFPSAPTNVTAAGADTALTAANANRTGLIVSNDSTAKLYVLVDVGGAGAASATNFTYMVPSNGTLELPLVGGSVPTARIRGFWSAANGSAGITDIS